jgi:hypothetical protein
MTKADWIFVGFLLSVAVFAIGLVVGGYWLTVL